MVPNEGDLDDTQNNKFKITTINMFNVAKRTWKNPGMKDKKTQTER